MGMFVLLTIEPVDFITGTLRGVAGREGGDCTSLNKPYQVLLTGIKAPYPPSPLPKPLNPSP